MINILINGALGRMGRIITDTCLKDKNIAIVGLVDCVEKTISPNLPKIMNSLEHYIQYADVVIDFSSPDATNNLIDILKKYKKPLVMGTTGHTEKQIESLKSLSEIIPLVFSPNMSLGVNIFFKLIEFITEKLSDKNYDIDIIEMHHNKKKDAPSGTAKKIMQIIKKFKNDVEFVFNRVNSNQERKQNEVSVNVIRAGDIVGKHSVLYSQEGEILEITHTATSRETFAKGAVLAAKWVIHQPPGFYNMFDVLGI